MEWNKGLDIFVPNACDASGRLSMDPLIKVMKTVRTLEVHDTQ